MPGSRRPSELLLAPPPLIFGTRSSCSPCPPPGEKSVYPRREGGEPPVLYCRRPALEPPVLYCRRPEPRAPPVLFVGRPRTRAPTLMDGARATSPPRTTHTSWCPRSPSAPICGTPDGPHPAPLFVEARHGPPPRPLLYWQTPRCYTHYGCPSPDKVLYCRVMEGAGPGLSLPRPTECRLRKDRDPTAERL